MAVGKETYDNYKERVRLMGDEELLDHYAWVRQSGFNFEKELTRNQILWRMKK